ncbi:MAG: DUF4258 domain-containing protein [Chloroflexota bacterium]|nr:DUF4258 domain-containing protein [Chloroflexota bacterium]
MKLSYWSHARVRIRERNISEAEVEAVLVNPEITRPGRDGRTIHTGHSNRRFIKVVIDERKNHPKL